MTKRIEDINFNLTDKMIKILIDFNNIKKELNLLKHNKDNIKLINNLELKLVNKKTQFIKEFRLNNKREIEQYLNIKNK